MAWIIAHAGEPEANVSKPKGGLHGSRLEPRGADGRPPARYVLPAGVLD